MRYVLGPQQQLFNNNNTNLPHLDNNNHSSNLHLHLHNLCRKNLDFFGGVDEENGNQNIYFQQNVSATI